MKIIKSLDVEKELQELLSHYIISYAPPLPKVFDVPCVLISAAGGSELNGIDSFTVSVYAYGDSESEACDTLLTTIGILKTKINNNNDTIFSYVRENVKSASYADPVRPDLYRYRSTIIVYAHQKEINYDK